MFYFTLVAGDVTVDNYVNKSIAPGRQTIREEKLQRHARNGRAVDICKISYLRSRKAPQRRDPREKPRLFLLSAAL
jgi:hypothetical protein